MKSPPQNLGVARFISDDPLTFLKMARYGTSMNLDGIWGGNMYAGGAGAILPNKITSKHNFRYIPNMDGHRTSRGSCVPHLDKHGYKDVEMKVIGDVPWAKMRYDTRRRAVADDDATTPSRSRTDRRRRQETILGPYWPAYLFAGDPLDIPIVGGAAATAATPTPPTSSSSSKAPGRSTAWPARKSRWRRCSTTTRD